MGLYEVPLYVSLLGFGIGTMLDNFPHLLGYSRSRTCFHLAFLAD